MTLDLAKLEPKNPYSLIADFAAAGYEFGHVCKTWNHGSYLRFSAFCKSDETLREYIAQPSIQALPEHKRMLAIYRTILTRSTHAVSKKLDPGSIGTLDADTAADGMQIGKIRMAIKSFHPSAWVELARITKQMEIKWYAYIQARPRTLPEIKLGGEEESPVAATLPAPFFSSKSTSPHSLEPARVNLTTPAHSENKQDAEESSVAATLPSPLPSLKPTAPLSLATAQNGWLRQGSSSASSAGSECGSRVPPLTAIKKFDASLDLPSPDASPEEPGCLESLYNWSSSWCDYFAKQITNFFNWALGY